MAANVSNREAETETETPTKDDYAGGRTALLQVADHLRSAVRLLESIEENPAVLHECEAQVTDATCDADEALYQVRVSLGAIEHPSA